MPQLQICLDYSYGKGRCTQTNLEDKNKNKIIVLG